MSSVLLKICLFISTKVLFLKGLPLGFERQVSTFKRTAILKNPLLLYMEVITVQSALHCLYSLVVDLNTNQEVLSVHKGEVQ